MNKTSPSSTWWRLLLAFFIFIVVLGLAYAYRDRITEIILIPILYVLWIVDLALQIFGQRCIWIIALMIALILSLVFSRRNEKPIKSMNRTVYGRGPAEGRIRFWRRRVQVNSNAINTVSYRRSDMHQLVIRALAYRENREAQEIEKQLHSGQLIVPIELSSIMGLVDQPEEKRKMANLFDSLRLRMKWIVGRFASPKYLPDPQIEKVAEYLENIMEVDNDA